jgi:hypothetical protein
VKDRYEVSLTFNQRDLTLPNLALPLLQDRRPERLLDLLAENPMPFYDSIDRAEVTIWRDGELIGTVTATKEKPTP